MQTKPEGISWVDWLGANHPEREMAVEQLRAFLVRGLKAALMSKGATNEFCEDIAHDSIIKILGKMDTFEGRSKFTTWAMSIAIRTGISAFRRRHFRDVSLDAVTEDGLKFDPADVTQGSPEDGLDRESILGKLQELIENDLTEKQRTVVRALLGGMPVEEIATRTDSNRNAVYKLFHDARQRLKKGFLAANFSESDLLNAISS
jgi:RNA polymerase sigma-70 factor (ECF subfamily)